MPLIRPLSNMDSLVLTKCEIVAEGFSKFTSLVTPVHSGKGHCTLGAPVRLLPFLVIPR